MLERAWATWGQKKDLLMGEIMKRLVEGFVNRAAMIGALYCILPTLILFGYIFATVPFRMVYLVRLGISLVVGGVIAAVVNRVGVNMWVAKHRSQAGPASLLDGALVGAGVGISAALVPPLTHLIQSSNLEYAKTAIIVTWLVTAVLGILVGLVFAAIGRKHLER